MIINGGGGSKLVLLERHSKGGKDIVGGFSSASSVLVGDLR